MTIRLGTRGSALALTQSGHVADALRALGHDVEIVTVTTAGDVTSGSLVVAGGTGVFAAALRTALLAGDCDIAVHSLKDLPTARTAGLVVAAIPPREDPVDALCARDGLTLAELAPGARVGTGSPRRAAQLRSLRPDLNVVEIRGNVPTRLGRVRGSGARTADLDAVVLARAGLARLGLTDKVTDVLDLLPAAAQGALAVECRTGDVATREALAPLDDATTRACVTAERAVLAALQAGCAAPVGALATASGDTLTLVAAAFSNDGTRQVRAEQSGPFSGATQLGTSVAALLVADGAFAVSPITASRESRLADIHDDASAFHDERTLWAAGTRPDFVGRRVLLARPDGPLAEGLREAGLEVTSVPLTRTVPLRPAIPEGFDWVVLSSPVGAGILAGLASDPARVATHVAAVGEATAEALAASGLVAELIPGGEASAAALVEVFPDGPGTVLLPGSALAAPTLAEGLAAKGWRVTVLPTYTTEALAEAPAEVVAAWRAGAFDAVVLTSGSIARATAELLGVDRAPTAVAFGPPTASTARDVGFDVAAVATTQDVAGVLDALSHALQKESP